MQLDDNRLNALSGNTGTKSNVLKKKFVHILQPKAGFVQQLPNNVDKGSAVGLDGKPVGKYNVQATFWK